YVEALFFRLSIEGSRTVEDGVRSFDKLLVLVVGKAKMPAGQIAAKNSGTRCNVIAKFRKFKMKLQRLPQAFPCFLVRFSADEQVERIAMTGEESRGQVTAQISG